MRQEPEIIEEENREETFSGQYGLGLKSLVKSMQAAFFVLAMVIVGMLIYYFTFGGYFTVSPQEYVLVAQFGDVKWKFEDGWHWVFPYPVNTIIKIPRTRQVLRTNTFMASKNKNAFAAGPEGPPPPKSLVPGKDGYVITGDENIMHTAWSVIYTIVIPEKYYLRCLCPEDPRENDNFLYGDADAVLGTRGPQTLLKAVLDNAALYVAARTNVDVLYRNSNEFTQEVESLYRKKIQELDIGIEINSVQLENSLPPLKTKAAFDEAIEAEQESSTMVEKARQYSTEQENSAQSEAATLTAEAESYKKRVVSEVMADEKYFAEILKEYKLSPGTVLVTLFTNSLAEAFSDVKEKYIINTVGPGQKQEVRIKINPEPVLQENKKSGK